MPDDLHRQARETLETARREEARARVHVGMPCPACAGRSRVKDTIHAGAEIVRQRECRECGRRWQTVETAA